MRLRTGLGCAAGQCAALVVLLGCSVPVQHAPVVVGHGQLREPTSSATAEPNGTRLVRVFLVKGNYLTGAYRAAPPGPRVRSALRALEEPLSHREEAAGYRSALPTGGGVPSLAVHGGIAYVGVPGGFARLGVSEQVLAVGQITDTLTLVDGVSQVQLVHAGHDVDIPVAGGELRPGPVSAADYEPVTAPGATTRPRSTTQPGSVSTDNSSSGSRE